MIAVALLGIHLNCEVVTYKPTEYGKPVQGKLIIQTEETTIRRLMYWIKMDSDGCG